jgi:hypothetical protein
VTFLLSGRQCAIPKLGATALGHYKLVPQPAPLSNCAPSEPALTSNHPPKAPQFGISPNSVLRAAVSELAVASLL